MIQLEGLGRLDGTQLQHLAAGQQGQVVEPAPLQDLEHLHIPPDVVAAVGGGAVGDHRHMGPSLQKLVNRTGFQDVGVGGRAVEHIGPVLARMAISSWESPVLWVRESPTLRTSGVVS